MNQEKLVKRIIFLIEDQLTPLVFDIFQRFRTFPIALNGDIEKDFL